MIPAEPTSRQIAARIRDLAERGPVDGEAVAEMRKLRAMQATAERRERGVQGIIDTDTMPSAEARRMGYYVPHPASKIPQPNRHGHWKTVVTSKGEERVWVEPDPPEAAA